jgi:flagellar motor switch protein FliG
MLPATGEEKAAILLRHLGPDMVESVLARLGPTQSGRLRAQLLRLDDTPLLQELSEQTVREFGEMIRLSDRVVPPLKLAPDTTSDAKDKSQIPPPRSGPKKTEPEASVRDKPEAPYSRPKLAELPETPEGGDFEDPIAILRRMDPAELARALEGEQARTVALVLSCLETVPAGEVLKQLPTAQRREVSLQLGDSIKGGITIVRRIVEAVLQKTRTADHPMAGPSGEGKYKRIADMLRMLEKEDRTQIVGALSERDPETAAKVKDLLYQFEDLLLIEDRSIQKLLADIDSKSLALALKGADEPVREKVCNNLSKRAREALEEEMEFLGLVPTTQILQGQKVVVDVIQRLDQAGDLVMKQL